MKTTLYKAVTMLSKNNSALQKELYDILDYTDTENIILEEGGVVEIQVGEITISFTWDMITAVNNITNDFIDLTSIKTDNEVSDFFKYCLIEHKRLEN